MNEIPFNYCKAESWRIDEQYNCTIVDMYTYADGSLLFANLAYCPKVCISKEKKSNLLQNYQEL